MKQNNKHKPPSVQTSYPEAKNIKIFFEPPSEQLRQLQLEMLAHIFTGISKKFA